MSIIPGILFLFVLAWQGRTAEAESGDCKVKADGGYVIATYDYDEDSERWILGEPIEGADIRHHNTVLFCWELPEDKRITGIRGTQTIWDGSTESYEDDFLAGFVCYYGTTEDGKVIWGCEVYSNRLAGLDELLLSPQIEDVDREPIIFDMRNGISYYFDDEYDYPNNFRNLSALFRYCGEWCNILEFKDPSGYITKPWHVDLDKDGSWDVEVTSEGEFVAPYDGGWWNDQNGVIISLPTRDVSGDYCVTLNLIPEPRDDINIIGGPWDCLFRRYGFHIPVMFRFGEEPTKKAHSVSVDAGYAEKYNHSSGKWERVTSAAPGDELRIYRNSFEGEYVSAWKSNYWSKDSITMAEQNARSYNKLYMPGADVSFSAVKSPQTPYYLDLTQGGVHIDYFDEAYSTVMHMIDAGSHSYDPENKAYDLNGDGIQDIGIREWGVNEEEYFPEEFVFVPLPTCIMTGDYTISVLNDGPNWPLVIKFPEKVYGKYAVSVKGGRAVDADGNTVTYAASGTLLYIESDFGPENVWLQYKSDLKGYWDEDLYIFFPDRAYFIMPAHDIVITPYIKDGNVIITPTPAPGEITPTPDLNESTPTPVEITPIPSVTPDEQDSVGQLTPVPTVSEADGKDEADTSKKDPKKPDGSSLLLYILIPVCAALIAVAAVAFWMAKKKQSKGTQKDKAFAKTPEEEINKTSAEAQEEEANKASAEAPKEESEAGSNGDV